MAEVATAVGTDGLGAVHAKGVVFAQLDRFAAGSAVGGRRDASIP